MKKLLFLLLAMSITTQFVLSEQQHPTREIVKSNNEFYNKCSKLSNNFKSDSKFANYLRGRCTEFEFSRQKLVDAVYPKKPYYTNSEYQTRLNNRSEFFTKLNKQQYNSYKLIVEEYCKANGKKSAKIEEACSNEMF